MSVVGRRIDIRGTVQGVGFRPWVYRLARENALTGSVRNDSSGVIIEAFGSPDHIHDFHHALLASPPPAAHIRAVAVAEIAPRKLDGFFILESEAAEERRVSIPPDLPTCQECLREVFDPANRRYRYPFTNCTNCGPRFTIATDIPYDRPATTMAIFPMCAECRSEYDDPEDRRFHAQPNACPKCGPRIRSVTSMGEIVGPTDPISFAARALRSQLIVAVKGLGGFHLACDATSSAAVRRLRERKRRDEKPFAVMVRDLAAAEALAILTPEEKNLLTSVERPIVLARKRVESALADEVSPSNSLVGLLLPYTPLHHLLLADTGLPLVMTSGNISEEPMAHTNDDAVDRLGEIADLLLIHDRNIETRMDDSVARVIAGGSVVLRRARGYVPRAINVIEPFAEPILACGAHLKNTFAIGSGDSVFLGPHIGDLENVETLRSFEESVRKMERFLRVEPKAIAHDLHPDYLSTRYALEQTGIRTLAIQHHHAHVASAMAEHNLRGPVIGVAYDGTGYGTDGTAWGGEILVADYSQFQRVATFRPIRLAGAHAAIHQVWRLALAMLDDAFDGTPPLHAFPLFRQIPTRAVDVMRRLTAEQINAPLAHGVGRYFDAFGALFLSRPDSNFEGQVATAWNMAAAESDQGRYPVLLREMESPWEIDLRPTVRAAVEDMLQGCAPGEISARFHNTLAEATALAVRAVQATRPEMPIVLTGGCFQNALLTERTIAELAPSVVYTHHRIPPGDGGIALGQVVIANALLRAESAKWMTELQRGDFAGFVGDPREKEELVA